MLLGHSEGVKGFLTNSNLVSILQKETDMHSSSGGGCGMYCGRTVCFSLVVL